MRIKYEAQLEGLNQELVNMGSMIEKSIEYAVDAFVHQDVELAAKTMKNDARINREQKKIENTCFHLLLQQQPVASDLRFISAAHKMVTDMERIGDHAADICEITLTMAKYSYMVDLTFLKKMAAETIKMLIKSIESYTQQDKKKAEEVIGNDDVVDELFEKEKSKLIHQIQINPKCSEQAADMLMVAKYFERIGDHAVNIAEWVLFALDDHKNE
ncbi:MAG: phosphate signaling complex protein PhoU [Lachnospiraceae bacterium]|nr:phosphate signaling complex protein PhoU [Lachnospiraceae bacterium]